MGMGKNAVDVELGAPKDIVSAYTSANPGKFEQNCQRCVPVYEMRRQGFDVEAMGGLSFDVTHGYECFENPRVFGKDKINFGNIADGKYIDKATLLKRMDALPEGSRSGIMLTWKDKSSGHVFVCEKVNGKLRFIDPQIGDPDCSRYLDMVNDNGFGYYRMDRLKLNNNIDWKGVIRPFGGKKVGNKAITTDRLVNAKEGSGKMITEDKARKLVHDYVQGFNKDGDEVKVLERVYEDTTGGFAFSVAVVKKGNQQEDKFIAIWNERTGECAIPIMD
jgi:hypothetical protein